MKIMKKTLLALVLFVPILCFAQTPQEKAVLQKIAEASASIESLSCDFTQVRKVSILNGEEVSTGALQYRREGQLLWKYITPSQLQIAFTDDAVIISRGTNTQVMDIASNPFYGQIKDLLLGLLRGEQLLATGGRFGISVKESGSEVLVKLVPTARQLRKLFTNIELTFNASDYRVKSFVMNEQDGSSTAISFTSTKVS